MRRSYVSVGVGAASLLLVLAVLSLSLLAALTALSAHNDDVLTVRSIAVAEADLELYAAAERTRAEISHAANTERPSEETPEELFSRIAEALPEGSEITENGVAFEKSEGKRVLTIRLCAVDGNGMWRLEYAERKLTAETEDWEWN